MAADEIGVKDDKIANKNSQRVITAPNSVNDHSDDDDDADEDNSDNSVGAGWWKIAMVMTISSII